MEPHTHHEPTYNTTTAPVRSRREVRTLYEGDCFGHADILGLTTDQSTLVASSDAEVLLMSAVDFKVHAISGEKCAKLRAALKFDAEQELIPKAEVTEARRRK